MRRSLILFPAAILLLAVYNPSDLDRARWTMDDMQTWRTAIFAYATDHGVYPEAKTLEALRDAVQPLYIVHAPMVDAWGNAYRYERLDEGKNFRLISAGADGKFDPVTWSVGGSQSSFNADAVITKEGRWLFRFWGLK